MQEVSEKYYKRDLWIRENLNYAQPHYRLEKSAHIINRIAQGKECDLLDVGCGPAILQNLLDKKIHYYGIDLAIHNPAPNLIQRDFVETPIKFEDKKFDIVVAQGVFEYIGKFQEEKFAEIQRLLNEDGIFFLSYVNFDHVHLLKYHLYNNMQSFKEFHKSLSRFFHVDRFSPTSYHWHHHEPNRRILRDMQMHFNVNIPVLGPMFAVEYFFICSLPGSKKAGSRA